MYNIDRNTPKWTQTARECYEIGCNCRNCLLFIVLGYRCKMKQAVFELVRKFGAPPEEEESLFTKYEILTMNLHRRARKQLEEVSQTAYIPQQQTIEGI